MVDPSVLTVYERTLRLNELGEILDGYEEREVEIPTDFRLEMEDTAKGFVVAEANALNILGSRERLNDQLVLLHGRRGIS